MCGIFGSNNIETFRELCKKNTERGNFVRSVTYLFPQGLQSNTLVKTKHELDFTKPYEIKEDANPYDRFLNKGEFGTGTAEDVALSKKVAKAFKLGFKDTMRGVNQMSGGDVKILGGQSLEELGQEQKELYESFEGPGGYLVAAAYFGGAILDPVGWLIPVTKAKTLYQMAKYGFVTSGIAGALGYVDEESFLDTRSKQAAASAVGGTFISPVIGAGLRKLKGQKTELGIPGFTGAKDKDITMKAAAESNLHKTELFNEAGKVNREAQFRDKIDIQENKTLKEIDSKGTFEADDEVGTFFESLKALQERIETFIGETTDGSQEEKEKE